MKAMSLHFQAYGHCFPGFFQRIGMFIMIGCLLGLVGCGEENLEPQYYNPSSPLPLRVEVTATPKPEPKEQINKTTKESTPTPTTTSTPTLTATSTPTPSPEPTQTPQKMTNSPTTTPVVITPEPEPTDFSESLENEPDMSVSAEKTPTVLNGAAKAEEKTTQQQSKKTGPIITPYGITIDKLEICSTVTNRNPVGCGETFSLSETGKVFTWMRVSGVTPPKVIKHAYYWEGKFVASVSLKLKYTSMRTWSQKTFKPDHVGKWKVVLTTEKPEEVLAVREWTVMP